MLIDEIKNIIDTIDFDIIFNILELDYYSTNVKSNYHLHKEAIITSNAKILLSPELKRKYNSIKLNPKYKNSIKKYITIFAKTLTEIFSDKDLTILYNNLNRLKIKDKNSLSFILCNLYYQLFLGFGIGAYYDSSKNLIAVDEDDLSIYHELFHMASTIYKNKVVYSGFKQSSTSSNSYVIGRGLNEGYTELLTERYFYIPPKEKSGYTYEVHLAKHLEMIIGQNEMTHLYLNANLYGLLEILENYANIDEITKFIECIDFISTYSLFCYLSDQNRATLTNSLVYVNEFLFKTYAKKLREDYRNHLIDKKEFNKLLLDYIYSLGSTAYFRYNEFQYFEEDLKKEATRLLNEINYLEDIDRTVKNISM